MDFFKQSRLSVAPIVKIGLVVMVANGLLWQSGWPLLGIAECGPPMPHRHLLIGGANYLDLTAHELAERACGQAGAGRADTNAEPSANKGMVLSLTQTDQQIPVTLIGLALIALLPVAFTSMALLDAQFEWWEAAAMRRHPSLSLPPATPPPKFS